MIKVWAMLRIAIAQMPATNDVEQNLRLMESLIQKAQQREAKVVVFPEMAYFMGHKAEWLPLVPKFDALMETFSGWAAKYQVELLPGSVREPVDGCPGKHYNTLPFFDATGKLIAQYRKIFLFKAKLRDREYDEEHSCVPGRRVVVATRPWGIVGLSICYDLRFPELFRGLRNREAQFIVLPAAFAVPTGEVHWHTLVRARAIENQSFVIAPGLVGQCGDGRETYGHSLIVSPWGEVLVDMEKKEDIAICDLDVESFQVVRQRVNVWASRRPDILPIP